jgi:hypothetical protein
MMDKMQPLLARPQAYFLLSAEWDVGADLFAHVVKQPPFVWNIKHNPLHSWLLLGVIAC